MICNGDGTDPVLILAIVIASVFIGFILGIIAEHGGKR